MKNLFVKIRNIKLYFLYKFLLKPIFFRNDPEKVHDWMTRVGTTLGKYGIFRALTRLLFNYKNKILTQNILGINFINPIGLSAGFDKNAELTDIMPAVGFGFIEVGSITGEPCEGNPKPRLWRLPESQSLVVWYGLKNDGCEAIAKKLVGKKFDIPIGISVAMTNCAATMVVQNAIDDFTKAFKIMEPFASYITVNISCPNTQGGQTFIIPENLEPLLTQIDTISTTKPVFVKLSPDMDITHTDQLLDIIGKHRVHGIITTNLTKKRENPDIKESDIPLVGGMSGKLVQGMSDDLLAHIYKKTGKKFVLIGSGGVFTAEDAYRKIRRGASLVQLITGMVYEGPQMVGEINRGLVVLLKKDGFTNISQAVGADIC